MKIKKHNSEQIIKKLREGDVMLAAGKTIGQVIQALEISEQTFHRWRKQYGGMKADEAKRLKQLEEENRRLKKLVTTCRWYVKFDRCSCLHTHPLELIR